jgi:hypothetical protein
VCETGDFESSGC